MTKFKPNENYLNYVDKVTPNSKHAKNIVLAFLVGGTICMIGQAFGDIIRFFFVGIEDILVGSIVSGIMIFIGALLTGIGVYDRLGAFAGAGSLVPITGFANSVVSPAMEYSTEGYVYGVASKMFIIAGPIIVNGVTLSAIVGIIYHIIGVV